MGISSSNNSIEQKRVFGFVKITTQNTQDKWIASGFIIPSGIITNAHILEGEHVTVEFLNGFSASATVIAKCSYLDLAVLQVEYAMMERIQSFQLANFSRTGQAVVAVGAPNGQLATSHGIIHGSTKPGILRLYNGTKAPVAFLTTKNMHLTNGYSGGPLLDSRGRVIGVTAYADKETGEGFAVPAKEILSCLS